MLICWIVGGVVVGLREMVTVKLVKALLANETLWQQSTGQKGETEILKTRLKRRKTTYAGLEIKTRM